MKINRSYLLGVVALAVSLPVFGGPFTPISSPDAAYLASTTYIDISGLTQFQDYGSITDGVLTVSFSVSMNKRTAPGGGWGTWSAAPDSQRGPSDTLPVLYSNGATSILMSLSMPVFVFGFEAEPNPLQVYTMTANFYDSGMNLLGTISRDVNGSAGARLFAASVDPISFVEFSSDEDFAVGAFRYSEAGGGVIPEPSTWILLGAGLMGLGLVRARARRRG